MNITVAYLTAATIVAIASLIVAVHCDRKAQRLQRLTNKQRNMLNERDNDILHLSTNVSSLEHQLEKRKQQLQLLDTYVRDARTHFIGAVGAISSLGYEITIDPDTQQCTLTPHDPDRDIIITSTTIN